jgi:hypothetical protein
MKIQLSTMVIQPEQPARVTVVSYFSGRPTQARFWLEWGFRSEVECRLDPVTTSSATSQQVHLRI